MEENNSLVIMAPVPDAEEYTASVDLWTALTTEIDSIVARIDRGEELSPDDVTNVRSLKKQVEAYLTTFNKAMREAQSKYKDLVAKQLESLGYSKIEAYIQNKRAIQQKEIDGRLAVKQKTLQELVEKAVASTTAVKETVLKDALFQAFTARFPIVGSGAKGKDISNWGPYEALIQTTLKLIDVFLADSAFPDAKTLPISSATMTELLAYVRDGNLERMRGMRAVYAKDARLIMMIKLRAVITSKEAALHMIEQITASAQSVEEKLNHIGDVLDIAKSL